VNYPHLCGLFDHLGVPTKKSDMTFACSIDNGRVEYGCKNFNTMLAQRANALKPMYWRMVRDILAFNSKALAVTRGNPDMTVGEMIATLGLGQWFTQYYLLPITGAIWSSPREQMRNFPAMTMAQFFENHGLLSVNGQHQWWTVDGGSREYVTRMEASMDAEIRCGTPVDAVWRRQDGVTVKAKGAVQEFDKVIFACHSDQALRLLDDPHPEERRMLERVEYKPNRAVLHTDPSHMPKRKACWSSWVYQARSNAMEEQASVTYWMNSLQGIPNDTPLFVTLNPLYEIDPDTIIDEHACDHPQFDLHAMAAQAELPSMQGRRGTYFCGAWTRHGFHEDGLSSAVDVAERIGITPPWVS